MAASESLVVTGDLEEVEGDVDVAPVMTTSFARSFDLLYGRGPRPVMYVWKKNSLGEVVDFPS